MRFLLPISFLNNKVVKQPSSDGKKYIKADLFFSYLIPFNKMESMNDDVELCGKVGEESLLDGGTSLNAAEPINVTIDDDVDNANKKRKKREKTALVWQYYEYNEVTRKAKCKYCGVLRPGDSISGTTGLKKHILRCVENKNKADTRQKLLVPEIIDQENGRAGITNLTAKCYDEKLCRRDLARLVIKDEQPFRIVEGEGFQEYSKLLKPRFKLPSRVTLARDVYVSCLEEKFEEYDCKQLS